MTTGSDNTGYLGSVGSVSCHLARTDRPWETGVDSIVVSVSDQALGNLGIAMSREFPDADWSPRSYRTVAPSRPVVLDLQGSNGLRFAVLATAHEGGESDLPTLPAIATASGAAVRAAVGQGSTTLGMPLLATGALGFSPESVAEVAVPAVITALSDLGPGDSLRRLIFFCLEEEVENAILEAWRFVGPGDLSTADLAGGLSSDLVDPNVGIPLEKDQLEVTPFVSMLATVIADNSTPLPLSVGIFGAWGSGKSYFMGMLRAEVDRLTRSANPAYCGEIVQIGFNAWHYADSNLWASLGDQIFRRLAGPAEDSGERRERLREELTHKLAQVKELQEAKEQAQTAAAELQADVEKATTTRRDTAKRLVRALAGSRKLWEHLGVGDEAEQGALLVEGMRGTLTEAEALRRAPRNWWGKVALATAAVVLLGDLTVALTAPETWRWLTAVGAAGFAVFATTGFTLLRHARSGIRALRELSDDLRAGMERAVRVSPEVAQMLDELRKAEAGQRVAEAQLDEVVAKVGELGRRLTELAPGRNLYAFLAERAQGDSYQRNLGLISTIRKDFEQLVRLMEDWRSNPGSGAKPIDRIVLYIDDLDRCGSRQVVEVLQAVHLLLALDLFVVVVGVDPRWLVRSLSDHYDELLSGDGDGTDHHVTPEDYLEKIINLPLVLPGMSSGSLRRLLSSLADVRVPAGPAAERPEAEGTLSPITAALEPVRVEEGSEVDSLRRTGPEGPPPRPLTKQEIDLLSALDHLVGTPREAKRLFNLYRMLRATRNLSEASRFLGDDGRAGEYEVVVALLGLLTAPARMLGAVLDTSPAADQAVAGGLARRPAEAKWSEFVDDCQPRREAEGWHNRVAGLLPDGDVPDWLRLHRGLTDVSTTIHTSDLSDFHRWVPVIRRFSYALSPAS